MLELRAASMSVYLMAPGRTGNAEFIPYVYGAASGWPSKGRPEKVLANPDLPQTALQRLVAVPETPPTAPGRPRSARCGSVSGAQRHYREGEKPCEACLKAAREDARERKSRRRAAAS